VVTFIRRGFGFVDALLPNEVIWRLAGAKMAQSRSLFEMERRDERADLAQGRVNGLAERRRGFIAGPQKWILFWSVSGVSFLPTAPSFAIASCAGCHKTNGEFIMSLKAHLGALAGFACLALFNICASAAEQPYAEGPVVSVSSIRTATRQNVDAGAEPEIVARAVIWKVREPAP
jgi:hypothetical protein